jgi:PilZ domain
MRERRQVPRYQYRALGRLILPTGEPLSELNFTTLSVRGCCVKGSSIPVVGLKCQLAFEWEGRQFQSEVKIMWKKANGEAGLTFTSLDEENLMLIRRVCATLHLEPMAPLPPEPDDD